MSGATYPFKLQARLEEQPGEHRLTGTSMMGGVSFHIEAIEVHPRESTSDASLAVNESLQNRIDAVGSFDEGHAYEHRLIGGKEYFIIVHPFQT